jgi:nicotinamide-nucleotide amidase
MDIEKLAAKVGEELEQHRLTLATAESCTGGWVAQVITSCPNSSRWFERGFVTYSNEAKREMLGVDAGTLAQYGAVSEQTARSMAEGAIGHSCAKVALSITGIAGPTGGSDEKPVGTVWIAWAHTNKDTVCTKYAFSGSRREIREQAVAQALKGLLQFID